jgi:hypothetical protein
MATPITEQSIRDQFQKRFQQHYGAGTPATGDWETAYKNEATLYGHSYTGGTQEDLDAYFKRREGELGLNKPPAPAPAPAITKTKPTAPPTPPPPGGEYGGGVGAGGGGGGGGGGGTFDQLAMPAYHSAMRGPEMMAPAPVQNLTGPSEGNPQLGNRILPMQQLKLALNPNRIY